ncbi:hypothetical protein WA026_004795 [Henosepilachna vigintioctopunctata]|uniref:Uncharacterized protein n=1 Tax=Henosepilachna vigintioctopunctata TaxID=420089 RepID=A0AAW1V7W3_9CUCU
MSHYSAIMIYKLMVICAIFSFSSQVSGLSSKLDFGDDSSSFSSKSKSISAPIKTEHVEIIKKNSQNLDNLEITCSAGGCNTTNPKEDAGSVKTDVLVKVKTVVDLEKKKKVEDIPDVPVIVGTNGAGSKNMQPIYSGALGGIQYQPTYRNYGGIYKPLEVTNIQKAFPSVTTKLIPESLYRSQTRDGYDIKFKTLPPLVVNMPDGLRYKANGFELKVPYFEPSYHNHYYGENSPPQIAYYPKKNVHNPVAFHTHVPRPVYSNWNKNYHANAPNHRHDENCNCQNKNIGGVSWYPSSGTTNIDNTVLHRRYDGQSNDPGSQINDKLAPLN